MTKALFRDDYGDNLEVYRSRLLDNTKIQLVKSIPGVKPPNPVDIAQQHQNPVGTRDVRLSIPKLDKNDVNTTLTTRVEFITESALYQLRSGLAVKVEQSSPCVISVHCGSVHISCQLPFPVNAKASTSRVARKSGWIEIIASLSMIGDQNGGYWGHAFASCSRCCLHFLDELELATSQFQPAPSSHHSPSRDLEPTFVSNT